MKTFGGIDISFLGQNLKNKKILDFGSGQGDFSVFCLKQGMFVTAVDIDPESEKIILNKLNTEEQKRFNFYCLNAEKDSLTKNLSNFDFILCREVLEHIANYEKVFKEFSMILNPGGVFILSIPTYLTEKYFYFWDKDWLNKCKHVNVFRKKEIYSLSKKFDLDLLKVGKHSFRRTVFWSMMTPFKVNHDMGKLLSHHKKARFASFLSDCVCYFKWVEKLGDFTLPKSRVFYLRKSI